MSVITKLRVLYVKYVTLLIKLINLKIKKKNAPKTHIGGYNNFSLYINAFLDLTHVFVQSAEEAYKVMLFGRNNLKIASNNLNKSSSRSHCIFTLKLMRVENIENPQTAVISRYTFVFFLVSLIQYKNLSND